MRFANEKKLENVFKGYKKIAEDEMRELRKKTLKENIKEFEKIMRMARLWKK